MSPSPPGFDEQFDENKALADEAIKRLPGIKATIQQAVGSNSQAQLILAGVSGDYNGALGTVGKLETVVSHLEVGYCHYNQLLSVEMPPMWASYANQLLCML